jgi:carboxypeptidase family protein
MRPYARLLLVLSLFPRATVAQEVAGSLRGQVATAQSKPLAEARITITGPSLQGTRTSQTDSRGFFQVLALPVGHYLVRVARIGFRPLVVDSVAVRIGSITNLGIVTLQSEAVELSEIVVAAPRFSIDPASTTIGANLDAETYSALPVGRDYRSVVDFLAHANTSYYPGDPVNIAGATGIENGYFIDGVNITAPHLGGGGSSFVLPYNFVRAVEVKEGGYSTRYGRSIGGTVNAVTYSGGNAFEGSVFSFFTNSSLAGQPSFGLSDEQSGRFTSYDLGGRIGGPVLRDRLWFSAAYNPQKETGDRAVPGFGYFRDRLQRHIFAGKLVWQAAPSTSLELLLFGDRSTHHEVSGISFAPYGGFTTATNPDPYLFFFRTGHTSASLRLTRPLGTGGLLEASVARAASFTRQAAETDRGASEPLYLDYVTSTVSGGVIATESPSDARTSASLRGTFDLGAHTFVAGAEYEDNRYDNSSGSNLLLRTDVMMWVLDSSFVSGRVHNRVPTLYAEDSWRVGERITINAGLRWSGEWLVGTQGVAQSFPNEWQPRVGASLQLGRHATQRILGSWGIFYQQQPLDFAFIQYVPFFETTTYLSSDPSVPGTAPDSALNLSTNPSQFANIPGLKVEHHREVTLGYERLFGSELKTTVRGVRRDLLSAFGFGMDPTGPAYYVLGVPGQGDLSFLPTARRTYTALELSAEWSHRQRLQARFSYVLSRAYGNYTGFYASDYGGAAPGYLGGVQLAEQRKNSTGLLPNDRTHVFKLSGAYQFGLGMTTGFFVTWQSGTPLNEFGASPYLRKTFLVPRGSAGRTPAIWDLNFRVGVPFQAAAGVRGRATLDWLHVGSPRRSVWIEQLHYSAEDAAGNPTNPNPSYGEVLRYQPPTQARLGLEFTF